MVGTKALICFFVIALSLCIYPVFLMVPAEISHVFGRLEADIFSWYRMWLILGAGTFLSLCLTDLSISGLAFIALLFTSTIKAQYFRTAVFGAPWMHEGFLVLLSYFGIYYGAKKHGLFKGLERSLDAVIVIIFTFAILQIIYGNFLSFPPIKWLMPEGDYQVILWPLYSTLGCPNNLGLFSALFFPYAIHKKKYWLTAMILFMAVASATRGAWLSIVVTSMFLSRRIKTILLIAAILVSPLLIPRLELAYNDLQFPIADSALGCRAYMWKRATIQLKETLLLGHGPGTFGIYFPQHERRGYDIGFQDRIVDRPHNMYINIWTGSGVVSLIFLLWMLGRTILLAKNRALQLSCFGFLLAGLFTDSVLSVTPYFIIFIGSLAHERQS